MQIFDKKLNEWIIAIKFNKTLIHELKVPRLSDIHF